jgi:hypothetical protein
VAVEEVHLSPRAVDLDALGAVAAGHVDEPLAEVAVDAHQKLVTCGPSDAMRVTPRLAGPLCVAAARGSTNASGQKRTFQELEGRGEEGYRCSGRNEREEAEIMNGPGPGSIMLATQASMAAEPVPETGTVKSLLV